MHFRKLSKDKRLNDIIHMLLHHGWIVKSTKKHIKMYCEKLNKSIFISSSPSDGNAFRQVQKELKDLGVLDSNLKIKEYNA